MDSWVCGVSRDTERDMRESLMLHRSRLPPKKRPSLVPGVHGKRSSEPNKKASSSFEGEAHGNPTIWTLCCSPLFHHGSQCVHCKFSILLFLVGPFVSRPRVDGYQAKPLKVSMIGMVVFGKEDMQGISTLAARGRPFHLLFLGHRILSSPSTSRENALENR